MNQKNLEYLRDQLKFTGFGEDWENQLAQKMSKQLPEFSLSHQGKFGNDTIDATLHFKKSTQSDMYFFNSYQISLKKENVAEPMQQTFYINKGSNITLKEAYNLLSGRAVSKDLTTKDGQFYNAWLQLDFKQTEASGNFKLKQYHQNYGFDLEKELAKHPIKELDNQTNKIRLIELLQKGNQPAVTFLKEGGEHKHFIEANPQFKTINIYDSNGQRLGSRQSSEEKQLVGEAKKITQKSSPTTDDEGPDIPPAAKKKVRKQSQSVT